MIYARGPYALAKSKSTESPSPRDIALGLLQFRIVTDSTDLATPIAVDLSDFIARRYGYGCTGGDRPINFVGCGECANVTGYPFIAILIAILSIPFIVCKQMQRYTPFGDYNCNKCLISIFYILLFILNFVGFITWYARCFVNLNPQTRSLATGAFLWIILIILLAIALFANICLATPIGRQETLTDPSFVDYLSRGIPAGIPLQSFVIKELKSFSNGSSKNDNNRQPYANYDKVPTTQSPLSPPARPLSHRPPSPRVSPPVVMSPPPRVMSPPRVCTPPIPTTPHPVEYIPSPRAVAPVLTAGSSPVGRPVRAEEYIKNDDAVRFAAKSRIQNVIGRAGETHSHIMVRELPPPTLPPVCLPQASGRSGPVRSFIESARNDRSPRTLETIWRPAVVSSQDCCPAPQYPVASFLPIYHTPFEETPRSGGSTSPRDVHIITGGGDLTISAPLVVTQSQVEGMNQTNTSVQKSDKQTNDKSHDMSPGRYTALDNYAPSNLLIDRSRSPQPNFIGPSLIPQPTFIGPPLTPPAPLQCRFEPRIIEPAGLGIPRLEPRIIEPGVPKPAETNKINGPNSPTSFERTKEKKVKVHSKNDERTFMYVGQDGKIRGPVSINTLLKWYKTGKVPPSLLVKKLHWNKFVELPAALWNTDTEGEPSAAQIKSARRLNARS